MIHATRNTRRQPHPVTADPHDDANGAALWIVLYAAAMVAALTLFAGSNLLGERFEPTATAVVWNPPA